jgi:hypothetical protein
MNETTLHGGCLCGAVRYTVQGEEKRFYHCHCSRCRKATGTGHASNLFVKGALAWDDGEDAVQLFKLPDAAHFANAFCAHCGGRVPIAVPAYGIVMIPAGSLDDEPVIQPEARIFTGSAARWACAGDDVPCLEEGTG